MVGMTAISGVAAVLEKLAGNSETEKVHVMNSWLTEEMRSMKKRLDDIFAKEIKGKEIEDSNIILALMEIIRIDALDMEIDGLDEKTSQLMEYEFPPEISDVIAQLKVNVTELNQDGIIQSLDTLEEYFRKGSAYEV